MTILLTVIAFVVIFSVLVLIHECGHYFAARKADIKVEEFGFGLPPRIWGVKKGETLFSINAIPFGGFVRLLGEDSTDKKALTDKRSFSSKPARMRLMVIVAGVFMNFMLAVVLLTVGFIFGIKPLILSGDDVLASISNGNIATMPGIIVKDVTSGSAAQTAGFQAGDRILALNEKPVMDTDQVKNAITAIGDGSASIDFTVIRNEEVVRINYLSLGQNNGLNFYEVISMPRVAVQKVKDGSYSEGAGVRAGDVILSINDKPIFFAEQIFQEAATGSSLNYLLLRDSKILSASVKLPESDRVIISAVYPGSNAEKAGLLAGDVVLSINGRAVSSPDDVVAISKPNASKVVEYLVRRKGQETRMQVEIAQSGLIGIGLSPILSYENNDLSLYSIDLPTSVLRINDVTYPFYLAPVKAFEESVRLGGLTISMFVNVIKSVFTKFAVPEGVAGPVGIAQMTSVFVQEGIMSLLRFMALLSLSLAMINILPLPALDGGRLAFIIIEVIIGRRLNQKFESIIHAVGFAVLMILIFAVTYSDILRLIFG